MTENPVPQAAQAAPSSAVPVVDGTPDATRPGPRRERRIPLVAVTVTALVGGLVVGGGATHAALAVAPAATDDSTQVDSTAWQPPTDDTGDDTSGTTVPDGTDGSSVVPEQMPGPAQGGASASTGTNQETSAATTEQQTGVVTIVSTLQYGAGASAGTGMVLTSDGLVLTNHHVVEGATSIEVTVETTGQTYTATVLGYDPDADVALLQLDGASGLSTVTLDDDGGVEAGDEVTAVGNANGEGELVAAPGTVTATEQTMTASSGTSAETLSGLIEFEAYVVSGDSGGALLDDEGEVVGMTTAASSGSTYVIAYAIDVEDALAIVRQIEAGDASDGVTIGYPAFLGVQLASTGLGGGTGGFGGAGGLGSAGGSGTTSSGTTIAGVVDGTPAAQAGLVAGDTITSVGGVAVSTADELSAAIATFEPGDEVTLTWVSGTTGTEQSADVVLAQGPVG